MKTSMSKRPKDLQIAIVVSVVASLILSVTIVPLVMQNSHSDSLDLSHQIEVESKVLPQTQGLLFYNRPPKTGSTTIRIAMKEALDKRGLVSARCFNQIEWNEMAVRTIINRRHVDFYGCHTRLDPGRFVQIAGMRGGNVTFMTSTRSPKNIILSAYLQLHRNRKIHSIIDQRDVEAEVQRYKEYVEEYPIDALYRYHGAEPYLDVCPPRWEHVEAMRFIAQRFEIVVDLDRPEESATMVETVSGLRPDFNQVYNERTANKSIPVIAELMNVDTSAKTCGNELVHNTLKQQFNIIKDRLMQNRCFDESQGTFEYCERAILARSEIRERNRKESFDAMLALGKSAP